MTLHQLKHFTRAVDHPVRSKIIELIEINEALTVTELYVRMRSIDYAAICNHLRILRMAGVLEAKRSGRLSYHYVTPLFYQLLQKLNDENN